jgi:U3 small nucleolar RNA-associated protein 4
MGWQVDNFKAAKLGNPCLLLTYTAPSTVVLLEHDWTDVWSALPAPMYRHRYGT